MAYVVRGAIEGPLSLKRSRGRNPTLSYRYGLSFVAFVIGSATVVTATGEPVTGDRRPA